MNCSSFLYRLSPLIACFAVSIMPSEAGLISYWELDETSGPTATATVGSDGTYENFAPGDFAQGGSPLGDTNSPINSVSLTDAGASATRNRINLGANGGILSGRSQLTVSMWANFDTVSGDDTLLSIGSFSGGEPLIFWRDNDDTISSANNTLAVLVGGYRVSGPNNALATTNQWHHLAFTFDGGSADGLQIFVDGTNITTTSDGSGTASTFAPGTSDPLTAGQVSAAINTGKQMDGRLDEIAFYGRTLTDAEIASLAAGAAPASIVPEPSSALISAALLGLFSLRRRRRGLGS